MIFDGRRTRAGRFVIPTRERPMVNEVVVQTKPLIVKPGSKAKLADRDPGWVFPDIDKDQALESLEHDLAALAKAQDLLYSNASRAVLVVLQAMDAAGKDGIVKHVMSGVNPQGCRVNSFKVPSAEE